MKKELTAPRLGSPGVYEETFREGPAVLLSVRARWPQLEGEGPGLRRINRYYDALAQRWKKRWAGSLLEQAKAANQPDSPPWEAALTFQLRLFQEDLLSLTWESTESTGQRRPRRIRQGDVWRLPQGVPLTLRELLPPARSWRRDVVAEILRQIEVRTASGESAFLPDWPRLASRAFSPGRFYLTQEGPVVFYPVEAIAPALEGFPEFPLFSLLPSQGEEAHQTSS